MENADIIPAYVKTDDNKVLNVKAITWIRKMSDCLDVCTRTIGCQLEKDTHKICKFHTPDSYNKLNALFD
jgi:hypothetical protein